MSHEDDLDLVPEPDASASDAEKARAKSFAALVDNLVSGKPTPPAMPAEERELLEVATMIQACTTEVELDTARRDRLIDKAFEQILPAQLRSVENEPSDRDELPANPASDITPLAPRRRRLGQVAPWLVAAVAAAAAVVFALRPPAANTANTARNIIIIEQTPVSAHHRSRPADPLIGRISSTHSAAASQRLDRIYDDRLSGFRDLRLRRRARTTGGKK